MKDERSIDIPQLLRYLPADLQIEFSENAFRRNYDQEEKAQAQSELKESFERQVRRGPKKKSRSVSGETLQDVLVGRTLEAIGRLFEESGITVFRRLTVFKAAHSDPERFEGIWKRVVQGRTSLEYAYNAVKRAQLQQIPPATPVAGEFDVIYADPPWKTSPPLRGSPSAKYPVMETKAISRLEVPSSSDASCFLWATGSMLPEALTVLQGWGFDYKASLVWVKNRLSTGSYFRYQHETLLLGTRGRFRAPLEHDRPASILKAPMRKHSEKPVEIYDIIERMFPRMRYLELFARTSRSGWTSWGNQLPKPGDQSWSIPKAGKVETWLPPLFLGENPN